MHKNDKSVFILGPCTIDNKELYLEVGRYLNDLMKGKDFYYKASFDKANRTSIEGGRGPGIEVGIECFKEIKKECPGIKLTTDVHEVSQIEKLAGLIDVIQVPAFLCRQTDLVVECAKHFDLINIKKMQHLGPNNLIKSVDKIKNTNPNAQAWLSERGTSFGYEKLIVDVTIVDEIKKYYDKFILDATHSCQRSRKVYGTQADRRYAERYLLAAPVFEYDGVFVETHPNPPSSTSDKDSQIYLHRMKELIEKYELIEQVVGRSKK